MATNRAEPPDGKIWVVDMEPSVRYPLYTRGNTEEGVPEDADG